MKVFRRIIHIVFICMLVAPGQTWGFGRDERIAFCRNLEGNWDIWTYDLKRKKLQQITATLEDEVNPVWLKGKKALAYIRCGDIYLNQGGVEKKLTNKGIYRFLAYDRFYHRLLFSVYQLPEDSGIGYFDLNTGSEGLLFDLPRQQIHPCATSDGKSIFYAEGYLFEGTTVIQEILEYNLTSRSFKTILTEEKKAFFRPMPSLDGTKLAFVSNRSGRTEVYRVGLNTEESREIIKISRPNAYYDEYPCWNKDGSKIIYTSLIDNQLKLIFYDLSSNDYQILKINGECMDANW